MIKLAVTALTSANAISPEARNMPHSKSIPQLTVALCEQIISKIVHLS